MAGASLQVTFVDVGQGDAVLLRSGARTCLIDGGPTGGGDEIGAALSASGARRINLLVITHAHADHIGGLLTLIGRFRPQVVAYAGEGTTATWGKVSRLLHGVGARFRKVRAGSSLALGALNAKILSPSSLSGEANDDSVVISLEAGGKRLLFCGDLHGPAEAMVATACARGPPVFLLKVAHHGSASSTSASFLSSVRPRFAVISVGENPYGHPSASALARLWKHGVRVYSTLRNGSVTLAIEAGGQVRWSFTRSRTPLRRER